MTQPDRITLVLRACEAAPLSSILPFVKLGELISVGRGLAVITAASQGDLVSPAFEREAFNIDDHVRMAADARRYRWLRQHGRLQDAYGTLLALSGRDSLDFSQMDSEIDAALRLQAALQTAAQEQQQ